jgi:uncharacterized protein involved in cysteine biosynthesis
MVEILKLKKIEKILLKQFKKIYYFVKKKIVLAIALVPPMVIVSHFSMGVLCFWIEHCHLLA